VKWFWIFCIVFILSVVANNQLTAYQNRLPVHDISARLDRIEAAVGRTESVARDVYDFESYQVWLQDWRSAP